SRPRLPLRFYLDIGLMETWPVEGNGPSLLDANRRLRQALKAKGYEVHEAEYNGGPRYANRQATPPDGLIFLLKKVGIGEPPLVSLPEAGSKPCGPETASNLQTNIKLLFFQEDVSHVSVEARRAPARHQQPHDLFELDSRGPQGRRRPAAQPSERGRTG